MLRKLRNGLEQRKGRRDSIETRIKDTKSLIRKHKLRKINIEKAGIIIQTVAKQTQMELSYRISEPVSLALGTIFDGESYSLKLEFPYRRNQTECDVYFEKEGELFEPMLEGSGGMIDVAGLALRASILKLHHPKPMGLLILDETFKHTNISRHDSAGRFLQEISKKLNIQILLTTHSNVLAEYANRKFKVSKTNGMSNIKETE